MRTVNTTVVVVAIAACSLAAMPAWSQHEEAEKQAVATTSAWLALVDIGKYAESWDAAAAYFRNAIAKDQWVKAMEAHRKPLGRLVSRKLESKEYATSLPGAPDGQYVVIVFKTVFEHKAQAVETVTPMLEADGTWRVSGYFIR